MADREAWERLADITECEPWCQTHIRHIGRYLRCDCGAAKVRELLDSARNVLNDLASGDQ